jgi:glycosyltransferase involved in cell wall biosynthesis
MRIGVDATAWANTRGYGRFTRTLLKAAVALDQENSYVFFADSAELPCPLPAGVEVVLVPTAVPAVKAASAGGRRSLADLWAMNRAVVREPLDLFFFPSDYTFFPILKRLPKLVTIHDATAELYPHLVHNSRRARFYWGVKQFIARRQAELILTVSGYALRCLMQTLRIPASRMRVVGEAADPVFRLLARPEAGDLLERHGLKAGDPFLIYVGGFTPHKNLMMLLDVFRQMTDHPAFGRLRLVLVGDYSGDPFFSCYPELRRAVAKARLEGRVIFTGLIADEPLAHLLNLSRVLVLPSFSEGFGLPAIEAAACGTPVVATTASPLPELLGEGGLYVEPSDRQGLLDALTRVLTDEVRWREMRQAALKAAASLTWENSARQLLAIFEEVRKSHHVKTA